MDLSSERLKTCPTLKRGTISAVRLRASHSAILWLHPDQLELANAVAREARLDVIGVGSPARGQGGGLANAFDCKVIEDLRAELATQVAAGESRTADRRRVLGDLAIDPAGQDAKAHLLRTRPDSASSPANHSRRRPLSCADLWSSDQTGSPPGRPARPLLTTPLFSNIP